MSVQYPLREIVDTLFNLFEQGAWDEAAKLFASDTQITQQFGSDIKTVDIDTFIHSVKHGPLSKIGNPVYLHRNVQIIGNDGFVERHVTQLTIGDKVCEIPVCLVGAFDGDGKISAIEEYLDPAPIMRAIGILSN